MDSLSAFDAQCSTVMKGHDEFCTAASDAIITAVESKASDLGHDVTDGPDLIECGDDDERAHGCHDGRLYRCGDWGDGYGMACTTVPSSAHSNSAAAL